MRKKMNKKIAPIYGFSVSGGQENGLLTTYMKGNSLLNGGAFGPEGGLIVTADILLMIGVWYWRTREQLPGLIAQLKAGDESVVKEEATGDFQRETDQELPAESKAASQTEKIEL